MERQVSPTAAAKRQRVGTPLSSLHMLAALLACLFPPTVPACQQPPHACPLMVGNTFNRPPTLPPIQSLPPTNPIAPPTHLDAGAIDDCILLHAAHRKASQVVLSGGIEAGHLGRLAAQQLAVGLAAALHNSLDDLADEGWGGDKRGSRQVRHAGENSKESGGLM